jgi:bifunctional non-homologous end joining protein LigD
VALPATYFVFDLLAYADRDLRPLPLRERKRLLARILPPLGPLRYCDHIERRGEETFDAVRRMGLEGVMAKRADAAYVAGRSDAWLKIRADRSGEFAIVGYSPPKRARAGFGALHCAGWDGGRLVYAGRVGTGFSATQARELLARLDHGRVPRPPCDDAPAGERHVWVAPEIVCEVRYKEWTHGGLLRQPVFVGERPDKALEDCAAPPAAAQAIDPSTRIEPEEPEPSLTNLDKVFWPDEGYTKGDLIGYYRAISRWILPYLEDRPVVLTRYPDGIDGKSFFQKDAPGFVPSWIRVQKMWSEHAEREIHYFVCDDERSLAYLINLGTIPLHLWASRVSSLGRPDWSILDLDPKGAPFEHVVRIARAIRALCEEIGLPSYVKTSGSTGLHVLVPLDARCTFEQSRGLAELLARIVTNELPEIATIARSPRSRGGRVYVDYLQNGHGKLLVAPFCVRPLAGAPVSTPLRWGEVRPSLDIGRFTIRSVPRRVRSAKQDPMRELLGTRVDLQQILERLAVRLGER